MASRHRLTADSLTPHPDRDRLSRQQRRGIKAWLLQWGEPVGAPSARSRVAAILPPRMSSARVVEFAQAIYLACNADATLMLQIHHQRQNPRSGAGPSPLEPVVMSNGTVRIGHSPCLLGRHVAGLHETSRGRLDWEEGSPPKAAKK
jgi:hypothetical protein